MASATLEIKYAAQSKSALIKVEEQSEPVHSSASRSEPSM